VKDRSPSTSRGSAPSKPVRLRDVADYLGLSPSTVSIVLNNSPVARTIARQTRTRILEAAEKLQYKANYFARALNQKRNYLIGILAPDMGEGYNALLITEMERALIAKEYLYFVSSHHWSPQLIQQRLRGFAERGVEGIVLINTPVTSVPDLPLVVIGSQPVDAPHLSISIDNRAGIRLACEHLYSLGHRNIAFMKGHKGSSDSESRWRSFRASARKLRFPLDADLCVQLERIQDGLEPIQEGTVAAKRLLDTGKHFTALVTFNDLSAVGAILAFKAAGYRVPGDISVVGFDNVTASRIVDPALTTIAQPIADIGSLAIADILAQIEKRRKTKSEKVLQPSLIVRQSTRAL
jgi:DNA-binding LacI/PurR family transcriptional regulator